MKRHLSLVVGFGFKACELGWQWNSLLLVALLCACITPATLLAQTPGIDPNLVLYFNFDQSYQDGHVVDVSGHGADGIQFNQTNLFSSAAGLFGSAAAQFTYAGYISNDFPSIYHFSQYISVTNVAPFEYLTNGTVSFWARFDTNNDFGMYVLDSGYDFRYVSDQAAASNSWTIGREFTPYLSLLVYPSTGGIIPIVNWPNDTVQSGGSDPNLATTSFHLYTVTIDCPNNVAITYYDGAPYMTNTINLPWLRIYGCSSIRWLCVGAMAHDGTPQWADDNYPNAAYFVGSLDEVRIYTRTLSANEVQGLYYGAGTGSFPRNVSVEPGASNLVQLSFDGRSKTHYQVEWRTDLFSGSWQPLGTPVLSMGTTTTVNDTSAGQGYKFYRVRPLP